MKKSLKTTLMVVSAVTFIGLAGFLPGYLFVLEKEPEYYESVSINMVFVSGHSRCSTFSLPSNRQGFHIASTRGTYRLSMVLPTRLGNGVESTIRNGVIDYQIVESC